MAKKLAIYTIHPSFPITPFVGSTFFLDFFFGEKRQFNLFFETGAKDLPQSIN
jgi:hypothetical protein